MKRKEKNFLYNLLNKEYLLWALDYNYDERDEIAFKESHWLSFKEAELIVAKLFKELNK